MKQRRRRQSLGSTHLPEGPLFIWIVFFFLFLPLLDFGAVCLRSSFLYMAVHNAARNAAKSRSFLTDLSGTPSATNVANSTVNNVIGMWNGVNVSSILTQIVVTDVNTDAVSLKDNPLATPADDSNNTYQIQVTVTGTVDPLVTFNMPWFGALPGLTKAVPITMSDRQYVENPQGLVL